MGVLMRFVWMSLGVGMGVLGWGWMCVWGCGWMSEFGTNGIVYMLILTISMNIVFGQKVDRVSFGKLFNLCISMYMFCKQLKLVSVYMK